MSVFMAPEVLEHKKLRFETQPSIFTGGTTIHDPGGTDVKLYQTTQPDPSTDGYPGDPVYGPYTDSNGTYWVVDVPPPDSFS